MSVILQQQIRLAVRKLYNGEVIAYPSEGVWGLGCLPDNPTAVANILLLKNRPVSKGLILVTDHISRLESYIVQLPTQQQLLQESEPTTWLINHGGLAPYWITGGSNQIAVRVSQHPTIVALCQAACSALVSTSANPANKKAAMTSLKVVSYFGRQSVTIVPGPLGSAQGPTQIKNYATGSVVRSSV